MGAQRLPDRPQGGAPAPRRGRRAVGYGSSHLSGSVKVALFVSVIAAAAAVATAGSAAVRPQSQTGATTGGHATELALAPRATPAIKATLAWSNLGLPDATAPVALSSPIPADLDGTMSVMFGDRAGNLFAFHLSDGTIPAGWSDVNTGHPVDSTPSVAPGSGRTSDIYVGSGNDAENEYGGYNAFGPSGNHLWTTTVANPPTNPPLPVGVEAGITVGYAGNRPEVVAGTLGQAQDALDPSSGAPLSGWPFFTSDSVHSTAALADLYGTGQNEIVDGGDQTAGLAYGQRYFSGGHIRVLNGQGGLICHGDTDQVVDSSPAVGGFLAWGLTGIVTGTGTYFPDVADSDRVIAFNTNCQTGVVDPISTAGRSRARRWPMCSATAPSTSSRGPIRARTARVRCTR